MFASAARVDYSGPPGEPGRRCRAARPSPMFRGAHHNGKEARHAMSKNTPVASYSLTVRLRIANQPGMLGKVTSAIGEAGGDIGAVDPVEAGQKEETPRTPLKSAHPVHRPPLLQTLAAVG